VATLGGTDLGGILKAIQQGVGDLIGGFRPDTTNPATAALGQVGKGLDLWDGLQYGSNPTAYTPPASAPMQGYRPPAPQGFGGVGGFGGGLWDGLSFGTGSTAFGVGAGPDLFGGFQQAKQAADQAHQAQQARDQAAAAFGGGKGATGADPNTDQWRTLIDEAAAQYGIDGDAIQAIMMIESQGNANARSGVGAMGLMQVMPFHFQTGEDGMDPRTNVFKGAQILADNYKRYGNWDSAVAAYLGAVDANGNPTTATDMYGTSGIKYAQMFNDNLQRIKAARTQRQAAPAGTGGMSSIWGGEQANVTQEYGVVTPGIDQDIYGYGAAYGLPAGHTGDDIGLKRGTKLYMPAGLTGVVEIAGGTPYFRDEDYGDAGTPGKGELRIRLSNGDILILGHTSQINVQAGQQVTGGQLVGLSGSASGDHLHLEVRVRQADGSYRLVDPAAYFGGR